MDVALRTETTLAAALNRAKAEPAPAGLARALDPSIVALPVWRRVAS
jgi:hypothetical protein